MLVNGLTCQPVQALSDFIHSEARTGDCLTVSRVKPTAIPKNQSLTFLPSQEPAKMTQKFNAKAHTICKMTDGDNLHISDITNESVL